MTDEHSPHAKIKDGDLVRRCGNTSPNGGMLGQEGFQAELTRRLMVTIRDLNKILQDIQRYSFG